MKDQEHGTFNIVRYYRKYGKPARIMQRGLTWKQAEKWVNDPKTEKKGEWFDGFQQTN